MKYNDEVIASYYFAYSNGKTEDVEYVFKDNILLYYHNPL